MRKTLHGKRYIRARKSVAIARDKKRAVRLKKNMDTISRMIISKMLYAVNNVVISFSDLANNISSAAKEFQKIEFSLYDRD